jgi:hypothetical protein
MLRSLFCSASLVGLLGLAVETCLADGAWSSVDVGRGHAGATAGYDAPQGLARTETHVGRVSLGRGLALGLGPEGLSLSHTIGVSGHRAGAAHNFQLSIGPNGTHVSRGGTVTRGGNTRVVAGGETYSGPGPVRGDSFAGGFGRRSRAWARSRAWHRW